MSTAQLRPSRCFGFALFKYFPHGGLQRDFRKCCLEAVRRGHRVEAFAPSWAALDDDFGTTPGVSFRELPATGHFNHSRAQGFAAALAASGSQVDLLLGFNKMPGLDAYYAADSCFVAKAAEQRPFWYRCLPRYRRYAALEAAVFGRGQKTRVLTISRRELARYRHWYGTEAERTLLLPPGIEPDRVAARRTVDAQLALRAQGRRVLGVAAEEQLLLFIGSGFRKKGLDRTLYAVASLPERLRSKLRLLVAGHDRAAPFRRLARRLGVADRVLWHTNGRDDIPACLAAGDALLLPAYDENTGTVILEAMLSGVPALVTANCGYAHYVEERAVGLVCPEPFRQEVLNGQLEMLLSSAARARWQANALAQGERDEWFALSGAVIDELERLAAERTPVATATTVTTAP